MRFSVYLAGKIPKGKDHETFQDWRADFGKLVDSMLGDYPEIKGLVLMNPDTFTVDQMPIEDFFGRDVHAIHTADAVLIDARGKIGAGTAQEMLIAKYYGKPVVTVLPEGSHYWRETHVHGTRTVYRHPFIFNTSDMVVGTFEDAAKWLLDLFSGRAKPEIKRIGLLDECRQHYLENHLHKDSFMQDWQKKLEK